MRYRITVPCNSSQTLLKLQQQGKHLFVALHDGSECLSRKVEDLHGVVGCDRGGAWAIEDDVADAHCCACPVNMHLATRLGLQGHNNDCIMVALQPMPRIQQVHIDRRKITASLQNHGNLAVMLQKYGDLAILKCSILHLCAAMSAPAVRLCRAEL